jgi:hypothetical protein
MHAGLHFSGFLVPVVASCERLAAPSQYQILLAFVRVASCPSSLATVPAKTPAFFVLTMQYFPIISFVLLIG